MTRADLLAQLGRILGVKEKATELEPLSEVERARVALGARGDESIPVAASRLRGELERWRDGAKEDARSIDALKRQRDGVREILCARHNESTEDAARRTLNEIKRAVRMLETTGPRLIARAEAAERAADQFENERDQARAELAQASGLAELLEREKEDAHRALDWTRIHADELETSRARLLTGARRACRRLRYQRDEASAIRAGLRAVLQTTTDELEAAEALAQERAHAVELEAAELRAQVAGLEGAVDTLRAELATVPAERCKWRLRRERDRATVRRLRRELGEARRRFAATTGAAWSLAPAAGPSGSAPGGDPAADYFPPGLPDAWDWNLGSDGHPRDYLEDPSRRVRGACFLTPGGWGWEWFGSQQRPPMGGTVASRWDARVELAARAGATHPDHCTPDHASASADSAPCPPDAQGAARAGCSGEQSSPEGDRGGSQERGPAPAHDGDDPPRQAGEEVEIQRPQQGRGDEVTDATGHAVESAPPSSSPPSSTEPEPAGVTLGDLVRVADAAGCELELSFEPRRACSPAQGGICIQGDAWGRRWHGWGYSFPCSPEQRCAGFQGRQASSGRRGFPRSGGPTGIGRASARAHSRKVGDMGKVAKVGLEPTTPRL